jgi:AcrR family transcriptional regulator
VHSALEQREPAAAWSELDPDAKRGRLLLAAERVFARDGLEAPMPAVAQAAGAGVGSLYRQFPSKDELVAALAERRLHALAAELETALGEPRAWDALKRFLWHVLGDGASDDVSARAIAAAAAADAPVREAREHVRGLLDALVGRAQAQGDMRADATRLDVSLVIMAARAVRHVSPAAWRRIVELSLDGLRAAPTPPAP